MQYRRANENVGLHFIQPNLRLYLTIRQELAARLKHGRNSDCEGFKGSEPNGTYFRNPGFEYHRPTGRLWMPAFAGMTGVLLVWP